jgi:hypothetical protein
LFSIFAKFTDGSGFGSLGGRMVSANWKIPHSYSLTRPPW